MTENIEEQENELRKLRGGYRKKRQFTRKQRGGRLSSTLKQGISRNYYHSQDTASQNTASQDTASESNDDKSQDGGEDKGSMEHFGKIQQLEAELTMLQSEVDKIRNLTLRMSDEYLDLDLLDEQARDILGQIRSDEVIIQ